MQPARVPTSAGFDALSETLEQDFVIIPHLKIFFFVGKTEVSVKTPDNAYCMAQLNAALWKIIFKLYTKNNQF